MGETVTPTEDRSHTPGAMSRGASPTSSRGTTPAAVSRSFSVASRARGGVAEVLAYLRTFGDGFVGLSPDSPADAYLVEDADAFLFMTTDPTGEDTATFVQNQDDGFVEIRD